MAKSREIKRRIKAVANIRRITKTMQMIATARFQAAQKRATAAQPYTRAIAALVGELAAVAAAGATGSAGGAAESGKGLSHPLLRTPAGDQRTNRVLLLVITSNRGLAGAYNGNVLRAAGQFLREHADQQVDLEVVGKKGLAFFRFAGRPVAQSHTQFGDQPAYDQVERVAERYMGEFSNGTYDAVYVCYMSFISMARQSARVLRLLPLENPAAKATAAAGGTPAATTTGGGGARAVEYDFSPEPEVLLSELLPITVKTQLFQAFNEAVVSEQIARMVAMKSATDAAGKMGKELSRQYNRARQAAITTELSEIIAGAASLTG